VETDAVGQEMVLYPSPVGKTKHNFKILNYYYRVEGK
jgi:hypothetical protein